MTLLTSMLFVPGGDEGKLAKLDALDAPALIVDLEDAVADSRKAAARGMVAEAVAASTTAHPLWVRVNTDRPAATVADLTAVVGARLSGVVLPKVESAGDVARVDWFLSALEAERGIPVGSVKVMPTVESVAGLAAVEAIAASSERIECLIFGAGDFSLDAGLDWPAEGGVSPLLLHAKERIVLASRLAGIRPPHDGVYPMFRDHEGLQAEAAQSRALGMFGKHAVHPGQIPVIDAVFTPSAAQIAHAEAVLAAFDASETQGVGNIDVGGQFIDYPVADRARSLLALAESLRS
ncbi:CoA ester lyase [Herbiconiux sp. P17]|uniref:HpcH/HpaI aldolase/citrate lyase family protein n=1 Tax=Herbiconiux wuyangfengii TaxID=3342794 RepID=UPI0035BADE65